MWLELQRQAQGKLRSELYSPLSAAEARGILEARKLGIASLRLLPKMSGALINVWISSKNALLQLLSSA